MNHGQIVAIDRPEQLKATIESVSSIEVAFKQKVKITDLQLPKVNEVKKEGDKFRLYTNQIHQVLLAVLDFARKNDLEIIDLRTLKPSLEDVFVKLTKKKYAN
jgi:ABC-2 type transport system ATP-binding protein